MMTSYSRSESSMTIETRSDPIDASLLRGERPSLPGTVLTTRQVNNFGFRRLSRLRHASSTQASSAEPLPFTFSSLFRRATNLKANLVGQDEEELGTGKSQDHGKEPGTRERARNGKEPGIKSEEHVGVVSKGCKGYAVKVQDKTSTPGYNREQPSTTDALVTLQAPGHRFRCALRRSYLGGIRVSAGCGERGGLGEEEEAPSLRKRRTREVVQVDARGGSHFSVRSS